MASTVTVFANGAQQLEKSARIRRNLHRCHVAMVGMAGLEDRAQGMQLGEMLDRPARVRVGKPDPVDRAESRVAVEGDAERPASSSRSTTSHRARLSSSIAAPAGPRYQGSDALMRWPPISQGTGAFGIDRRVAHQVDAVGVGARAEQQPARVDQRHEDEANVLELALRASCPSRAGARGCADRRPARERRSARARARRRRIPRPARPGSACRASMTSIGSPIADAPGDVVLEPLPRPPRRRAEVRRIPPDRARSRQRVPSVSREATDGTPEVATAPERDPFEQAGGHGATEHRQRRQGVQSRPKGRRRSKSRPVQP